MLKDKKHLLALWLRDNKENEHKIALIDYLQEKICRYSNEEMTPAEQIKGMNRLLRDVIKLPEEVFEVKE